MFHFHVTKFRAFCGKFFGGSPGPNKDKLDMRWARIFVQTSALASAALTGTMATTTLDAALSDSAIVFDISPNRLEANDLALKGVVVSNNSIMINFGAAATKGNPAEHNKIVRFPIKGGGSKCTTVKRHEIDMSWKESGCVTLTQNGKNSYTIEISTNYDFGSIEMTEHRVSILKNYNFHKSARQTFQFEYDLSGCEATILIKEFIPLDAVSWKSVRGSEKLICQRSAR